ncbi:hypothetical protein Pmani_003641 [Petrolisthes manimaculis]|uniref:Uncharacterized protein n=1 Tax=Petrolisthes manimaculis TaxID=1843537 RepID=A0AAE1UJ68_9EUCA|nr:hypothetical protein Pmani_003641 [Petrolisthes manimaculis]
MGLEESQDHSGIGLCGAGRVSRSQWNWSLWGWKSLKITVELVFVGLEESQDHSGIGLCGAGRVSRSQWNWSLWGWKSLKITVELVFVGLEESRDHSGIGLWAFILCCVWTGTGTGRGKWLCSWIFYRVTT